MTLVSLKTLLRHAKKHQYAIPAFNISFQEQAQAVLEAAEETQSPVIIQFSKGGLMHASTWFLEGLRKHIQTNSLPICLHRDHCHTLEEVQEAAHLGFSSIMMDGSLNAQGAPNSLIENIEITRLAKMHINPHISIEGEVGCLGALDTGLSGEEDGTQASQKLSRQQMLTDPNEAKAFVEATQVDCLAVAIGTSHGAYKFSSPPNQSVLAIERIQAISKAIPNTPLVLHGSSSISQSHLETINHCGGQIPDTYGVPVEAIQEAIQHGVCKVNIDTDLRIAATMAIRAYLKNNPDKFDPRGYLCAAKAAMKQVCIDRYIAFGSQNQARDIQHDPTSA